MVREVLEGLTTRTGSPSKEGGNEGGEGPERVFIDCTLGGGGHAEAILEEFEGSVVFGIDQDDDALFEAGRRLSPYGSRVRLLKGNFRRVGEVVEGVLSKSGTGGDVDGVLLDIGVSSFHLDSAERGFSFTKEGPLDMRMDRGGEGSGALPTAATLVNTLSKDELKKIFYEYGEERYAGPIAKAIVEARESEPEPESGPEPGKAGGKVYGPIETTTRLAAIIEDTLLRCGALKGRKRKGRRGGKEGGGGRKDIHPATRVFQALRIAVNDELGALREALPSALELLRPGGRLVVISFHSLEDRIVKGWMRQEAKGCICPPRFPHCVCGITPSLKVITKRPLVAGKSECDSNPRARSAKIRVAERL